MSHFAKVIDGIVTKVIVAEQDYIDNVESGEWVQTSYNTVGGKPPESYPSDGKAYKWDEGSKKWVEG